MSDDAKRKPGRPDTFNPEAAKRIINVILMGGYIETAAAYGGIHRDTLYRWLKRGRAKSCNEPDLIQFVADYDSAIVKAEVLLLTKVQTAAQEDWKPAAFILERRYPERWGRQRLELSGPDGGPISFAGDVKFYIPDNGRESKKTGKK